MPLYLPAMICLFSSSPFGPPAISTNVGTQSNEENISLKMVPGLMTPGQRMTHGARMPLSQVDSFPAGPSGDFIQRPGRGERMQVPVLGSTPDGGFGTPGIGIVAHGGPTVCSVGLLLMSGKLTCCIASR